MVRLRIYKKLKNPWHLKIIENPIVNIKMTQLQGYCRFYTLARVGKVNRELIKANCRFALGICKGSIIF